MKGLKGVSAISVSLLMGSAEVDYDPAFITPEQIAQGKWLALFYCVCSVSHVSASPFACFLIDSPFWHHRAASIALPTLPTGIFMHIHVCSLSRACCVFMFLAIPSLSHQRLWL